MKSSDSKNKPKESKNLDLKRFKKISADKQSTTMRHDDGHVLKIAHSALSKNLLGKLSKLPMLHAEPQDDRDFARKYYQSGGEVDDNEARYLKKEGILDRDNLQSVAEHEARSYGQPGYNAPKILESNDPESLGESHIGTQAGTMPTRRLPSMRGESPLVGETNKYPVGDSSPGGYISVRRNSPDKVNTVRHEMSHQNFHKHPDYGVDVKYGERIGPNTPPRRSAGDPTHGFAPHDDSEGNFVAGPGYLLPGKAKGGEIKRYADGTGDVEAQIDPSNYDSEQSSDMIPLDEYGAPATPEDNSDIGRNPASEPSTNESLKKQADYWTNQQYANMPADFKEKKSQNTALQFKEAELKRKAMADQAAANKAESEALSEADYNKRASAVGMPTRGNPQQAPAPAPEPAPAPQPMAPKAPTPQRSPLAAPQAAAPQPAPLNKQVAQHVLTEDEDLKRQFQLWTPEVKTHADLFAKKDTLGKIGTLFGLLLGGAGAGLTKTSNPVLDAMDQTLKSDLEAQKQGRQSVIDWRKLTVQHELEKAQAGHLAVQDAISIDELTQLRMARYYQGKQWDEIKKMPDGPMKQQAIQAFGAMSTALDMKAQNAAASIGGRTEYLKSIMNNNSGAPTNGPIDYNKLNQLERNSIMKIPGSLPEGVINEATKETKELEKARMLRKSYIDSFNQLNQIFMAGKLSPNQRSAAVNALGAALAREVSGKYTHDEAFAQADGMFPSYNDWGGKGGKTRELKFKKGLEIFDQLEAGTPTLNRLNLKNQPPSSAAPSSSVPDGTTGTDKRTGKPVIRKNGAWVYR